MSTKVWDVVAPKDNWERNYAHMEYLRVGLLRTFSKRILVFHVMSLGDYLQSSPFASWHQRETDKRLEPWEND